MLLRAVLLLVGLSAAMTAQDPVRPASQVYLAFQVDKAVSMSPKNKAPEYPRELRVANVEGQVLVKFVVDADGKVVDSTVRIVHSDNDAFSKAVRDALPHMRFEAAELKGKRVAQIVEMPFVFNLAPRDTG